MLTYRQHIIPSRRGKFVRADAPVVRPYGEAFG